MRDISHKPTTLRVANARATVKLSPHLIDKIKLNEIPKGNALEIARCAAIQAAKMTGQLIPYCHPIPIEFVEVNYVFGKATIDIQARVKTVSKTGVEMEAMTAASVAALTIYDMVKMFDESVEIQRVSLLSKSGGQSDLELIGLNDLKAAVVVISDSTARGDRADKSGKQIVQRIEADGVKVEYVVVQDDQKQIIETLKRLCDELKTDLVITTGGTGVGPRDCTPEAISHIIDCRVPGIDEALRSYGQSRTSFAMLSRAQAGLRNKSLIISLPGSVPAVQDSLNILFPAIWHSFTMIRGEGHEVREHCHSH